MKGDDKTFIHSGICIGVPYPIHREEINISSVPWQGREDIIHPEDTHGGVVQPRWRTGSPWSVDHSDEEAKTEEHSLQLFTASNTHLQHCIALNIGIVYTFSLLPLR